MPFDLSVGQVAVWLVTVAVTIGIPVAVLAFVFRLGRRTVSTKPEEVLRSRFARGEMTQDEFDAASRVLNG